MITPITSSAIYYYNPLGSTSSEKDVEFTRVLQTGKNIGGISNSKYVISKGNSSNFTHVEDPSSLWPGYSSIYELGSCP